MYVGTTEVRVGGGCRSRETGADRGMQAEVCVCGGGGEEGGGVAGGSRRAGG